MRSYYEKGLSGCRSSSLQTNASMGGVVCCDRPKR